MKGIPMKTWEVQAILDGRKTVMRRVVKPQPKGPLVPAPSDGCWPGYYAEVGTPRVVNPPCRPGDTLYVQETWAKTRDSHYLYRAWSRPGNEPERQDKAIKELRLKWRPSIHMPREAARIFLRVTDVKVERLQDIKERGGFNASAEAEGFCNDINLYDGTGKSATKHFAEAWDRTIKPKDRALYGWEANPWVWVIEFDRISGEEALTNG